MEDKKKYVIPEAEITDFDKEDIITMSGDDVNAAGWDGEEFQ